MEPALTPSPRASAPLRSLLINGNRPLRSSSPRTGRGLFSTPPYPLFRKEGGLIFSRAMRFHMFFCCPLFTVAAKRRSRRLKRLSVTHPSPQTVASSLSHRRHLKRSAPHPAKRSSRRQPVLLPPKAHPLRSLAVSTRDCCLNQSPLKGFGG